MMIKDKNDFINKMNDVILLFCYLQSDHDNYITYGNNRLYSDENFLLYSKGGINESTKEEIKFYKSNLSLHLLMDLVERIKKTDEWKKVENYKKINN